MGLVRRHLVAFWPCPPTLAVLAATYGDDERAVLHFDGALALDPDRLTGSPYAIARCRYEYARLLLARNAVNNRDRVLDLIEQARRDALRFEMQHLGNKLDELAAARTEHQAEL